MSSAQNERGLPVGEVVVVSLCSAALFATGNSLQHLAASSLPDKHLPVLQVMRLLLRRWHWLAGAFIAAAAFGTHVLALSVGRVGVVQPLLLSGVVMAILVRPLLGREWPKAADVASASVTVLGLVLYVVSGAIADQQPRDPLASEHTMVLGVVATALVAFTYARRPRSGAAFVLAATAGLLMGTGAMLVKSVLESSDQGTLFFLDWRVGGVLALGLAGTALNQKAYHLGTMTTTMPALNVASVVIGGVAGAMVFGEFPRVDAMALVGQGAGVLVMSVGLVMCARRQSAVDAQKIGTRKTPARDAGAEEQSGSVAQDSVEMTARDLRR